MDKSAKKVLRKIYQEKESEKIRESLPMQEADFLPLFDFLGEKLQENGCRNDLSLTESYCKQKGFDFYALAEWFKRQGGFCDCEIASNVAEQFEYLKKPAREEQSKKEQSKKTQSAQRRKLDSLTTDSGFSIKKIPAPWVLISSTWKNRTDYQFQIGKKSGLLVKIENDFPIAELSEEKFLCGYWIEKTELDKELEFIIDRQKIQKFETIQIHTKRWTPVFLFIFRKEMKWCLIMRTETARIRNDIKELERLLAEICPPDIQSSS